MHRVEEVHPDDALGVLRGVGDLRDGERRGVGGEQDLRTERGAEPSEEIALEVHALGHGLHDDLHPLDGSL